MSTETHLCQGRHTLGAVETVQRQALPRAERKRQIMALVGQGWSQRAAGKEFGVSQRTVNRWAIEGRTQHGAALAVVAVAEQDELLSGLTQRFRAEMDKPSPDPRALVAIASEIGDWRGYNAPLQSVNVTIQHVMGVGDDQDPLAVFSRSARQLATAAEQHQEQARALLGAGSKVWQAQQAPGEPPQAGALHTRQEPLPNLPHFSIDQTPVLDSDSSLLPLDSDLLSPVDDDPDV